MTQNKIDSILLIDDEYVSNLIISKYLGTLGFSNIEIKTNGQEALSFFAENSKNIPTIIFLDLRMPIMDGFEFLDEISKADIDISRSKIYVLTSSINPLDMEKAKNYNLISGFIQKPIHPDKLKAILS